MPTVFKGKKFAYQGDDIELIQGIGQRTTKRYAGEFSEITSRAFNFYGLGWNVRYFRDGDSPIWRLDATAEGIPGSPDQLVDIHELHGNVLNPPNTTSPVLRAQFVDPDGAIAFVQKTANSFLAGKTSYSEAVADLGDPATLEIGPTELLTAQALLNDLIQGVNHYIQFQFVYRHTYNFGPVSSLRAGVADTGKIFSPVQLITAENVPNLEAQDIEDMGGQWLKLFPSKRNELGQRRQVVREYWWSEVASTLYYETV